VFLKDFLKALLAYPKAFKVLVKLRLGYFFLAPMLISIIIGFILFISVYLFSDDIGTLISDFWVFDIGVSVVETIGDILGGLIILVVGLVLYKHIVMAFSAPFMSILSEKIEEHYYSIDASSTTMLASLQRGLRMNIRNLVRELFFVFILLLIGLIPFLSPITVFLILLIQSYYSGYGNMDYTLERHCNYGKSVSFVKNNRGLALGNGFVYFLGLLVPIFGILFILPLSTTSATLVTLDKINENKKIGLI
jgi:CysZ protein